MSLFSIADLISGVSSSGVKYCLAYDGINEVLTVSNTGKKMVPEEELREAISVYRNKVTKVILDCKAPKSCTCLFKDFTWLREVVCTENWDTSDTGTFTGMFSDCPRLETVNGSDWNVSNAHSFVDMFRNCKRLLKVDLTNWEMNSNASIGNMFYGCEMLSSIGQPK